MNSDHSAWQKLVSAARLAPDDRSEDAPLGFATRVVATAMSNESRLVGNLFERWSWRALAVAGIFAAAGVATNYATVSSSLADDLMSEESTVATLFD